MEEEKVVVDNENTTEDVVLETTEETTEPKEETVEDYKAKLAKAEETARNQKIRAEKAEKLAKDRQQVETPNLSTKDAIALMEHKVKEEEDIEEVENWAKYKGINIWFSLLSLLGIIGWIILAVIPDRAIVIDNE